MILAISLKEDMCCLRTSSMVTCLMCASCTYFLLASAHQRWSCPTPRSPDTGIKNAVCGNEENDFGQNLIDPKNNDKLVLSPGPFTVVFEESIPHAGAPTRIALSADGSDKWEDSCVLLDHIPHDENSKPAFGDDSTYHQFWITVEIPDITCDACSLHLGNPMTDKIGADGAISGKGCTDPYGSCFSVYHSCTKTFKIKGSSTAVSRNNYVCPYPKSISSSYAPSGWPESWLAPNTNDLVSANNPGLYRRESAKWSCGTGCTLGKENWIVDVPGKYSVDAKFTTKSSDGFCAAQLLAEGEGSTPVTTTATNAGTTGSNAGGIASTTESSGSKRVDYSNDTISRAISGGGGMSRISIVFVTMAGLSLII